MVRKVQVDWHTFALEKRKKAKTPTRSMLPAEVVWESIQIHEDLSACIARERSRQLESTVEELLQSKYRAREEEFQKVRALVDEFKELRGERYATTMGEFLDVGNLRAEEAKAMEAKQVELQARLRELEADIEPFRAHIREEAMSRARWQIRDAAREQTRGGWEELVRMMVLSHDVKLELMLSEAKLEEVGACKKAAIAEWKAARAELEAKAHIEAVQAAAKAVCAKLRALEAEIALSTEVGRVEERAELKAVCANAKAAAAQVVDAFHVQIEAVDAAVAANLALANAVYAKLRAPESEIAVLTQVGRVEEKAALEALRANANVTVAELVDALDMQMEAIDAAVAANRALANALPVKADMAEQKADVAWHKVGIAVIMKRREVVDAQPKLDILRAEEDIERAKENIARAKEEAEAKAQAAAEERLKAHIRAKARTALLQP